jgi:hypothetical protein
MLMAGKMPAALCIRKKYRFSLGTAWPGHATLLPMGGAATVSKAVGSAIPDSGVALPLAAACRPRRQDLVGHGRNTYYQYLGSRRCGDRLTPS